METSRKESDQLPEDGPADQVPDDTGTDAREDAEDNAGAGDDQGQATGHLENAG